MDKETFHLVVFFYFFTFWLEVDVDGKINKWLMVNKIYELYIHMGLKIGQKFISRKIGIGGSLEF